MTEYKDLPTADLMNVFITSNIESFTTSEKRFDKSITVSDLKSKLEEMIPGGSALTMKITAVLSSWSYLYDHGRIYDHLAKMVIIWSYF